MRLKISHRLQSIAEFLPRGSYFADIGTDHAYLPCYVCLKDPEAQGIAGEVKQGPYERALDTVQTYGLSNQIDVRLGNGLQILDADPIKQLVIAGMGGSLMKEILNEGIDRINTVERIILQPNIGEEIVRKWLYHNNFAITYELIIEDNNHLYEIIVADYNEQQPYANSKKERQKQFMFGPKLIVESSALFKRKWSAELDHLKRIVKQINEGPGSEKSSEEFIKRIHWIEEVLANA